MTVELILTIAGTDTGPFNLYSDVDSFSTAFEVGVTKAALLAGYSTSLVPNYTGTIRIMSVNSACNNYVDVTLSTTTTTTTAIPTGTCMGYTVTATSHFSIAVSYIDCNSEFQDITIAGHDVINLCAIQDTVFVNGPASIVMTTPCPVGEISLRSTVSDVTDACPLLLEEVVYITTAVPGVITTGDRVFNDVGLLSPFMGDGNYYALKVQSSLSVYNAKVDTSGYVIDTVNECV